MSKLIPEVVFCPTCGKRFTNQGFQNHVNKCKNTPNRDKETIRRIRHLPK